MSLHSAGQVVQSVKLFSITDNCRKDLVFVDFVGLCGGKNFKKNGGRRRVGVGVNSSNAQRNHFRGLAPSGKSWASSIDSVLDLERVKTDSQKQSPDPKPKVYGWRHSSVATDEMDQALQLTNVVPTSKRLSCSLSVVPCAGIAIK